MALRDWIASFAIPATATPATIATPDPENGELSQLSQGVGAVGGGQEAPQRSQVSQLSQPVGSESTEDEAAREAFEERAAIMEYDGGLSREDAERHAAVGFRDQYAPGRARARGKRAANVRGEPSG